MCVLLTVPPPCCRIACAKRDAPLTALLILAHALRSAHALTRGAALPLLAQALQSAAYSLPPRTRAPALLRAAGWTTPLSLAPSCGRVSKRSSPHPVQSCSEEVRHCFSPPKRGALFTSNYRSHTLRARIYLQRRC